MFKRVFRWLLVIAQVAILVPRFYAAPAVDGALIYAPRPQRLAPTLNASGIFILRVKIKTGQVTAVEVAQSTGAKILDNEAVRVLKKWLFKPGVLPPIKEILPNRNDRYAAEDSLVKVPIAFR